MWREPACSAVERTLGDRHAGQPPLLGRDLSGRVLLTIAGGRLAYEDREAASTES